MKRLPRLQIRLLDQVLSLIPIAQEQGGGAIQIRQIRRRYSLETFELDLPTKKQVTLQTGLLQNSGSGGLEWQSQAAAPRVADSVN
jgi:hypothetical protein